MITELGLMLYYVFCTVFTSIVGIPTIFALEGGVAGIWSPLVTRVGVPAVMCFNIYKLAENKMNCETLK